MNRVAIVVQRWHPTIVGGSEALAWQYATLLREAYRVDLLTTTATDYMSWANVLPPGREVQDGVTVCRFPVTLSRSPYWRRLHERLLETYGPATGGTRSAWSLSLEEEFIRHQGPYSAPLLRYLGTSWPRYRAILFITYLYPTTYFGMGRVPPARALLVPTLHDEPTAYLKAFKFLAWRARRILWLTEAERRVGDALWGPLPGRVTALAVETLPVAPAQLDYPYLLYCGRIEAAKGCDQLLEFFLRWKASRPSLVRLVLSGDIKLELPAHPDIDYRGLVPAREKFALMAGATLFIMPSRWESFSLATLEAMAQGTPVLVNAACPVLVDHVTRSGVGAFYGDYEQFRAALEHALADETSRPHVREQARSYVVSHFCADQVRQALIEEVEDCPGATGAAA